MDLLKYVIPNKSGGVVMNNEDMKSIFDQINNLKKPVTESKKQMLSMKRILFEKF